MAKPPPIDPAALERAAAALLPIERDVLLLSASAGLRYDEIGARLGISSEEARGHLADALYRLDRELARPARPWWKFW